MKSRAPVFGALLATSALLGSLIITATPAAGQSDRIYTIGVDGAGPPGHNFEYVDYFPRGQVLPTDPPAVVGNGAVIHFEYNFASLDGLHTATLLPAGETPEQAWATLPLIAPDEPESAPPPNVVFNPAAAFPNLRGCGTASNPCTYDGTKLVNSGALPAFAGADFFVRIAVAASTPTTVHYVCLIHPGMQGNIKVVPGQGSSPSAFADAAATQLAADTADALAAESAVSTTSVSPNADGTRTVTMTAGTATQFVEVVEMLPHDVSIHKGDTVRWVTFSQKDPHTVTFPDLGDAFHPLDPIQPVCEGATGDTPPTGGPPDFGCGASPVEFTVIPFPQGGTQILSPGTFATSGIIATFPPFGNQFSFSFPTQGTFAYQCRIHDHMNGTIAVTS